MLDLAQEMIRYRKNESKMASAKPALFKSLFIDQGLLISFFVLMAFCPDRRINLTHIDIMNDSHGYRVPPSRGVMARVWPYVCMFGMAASGAHSIVTIYKHMISTKQNYEDAIEIKNLLMKCDIKVS